MTLLSNILASVLICSEDLIQTEWRDRTTRISLSYSVLITIDWTLMY
ncbi:MAG: hypothetical protein WA949_23390 [Phormidesmis sp.]